MMSIKNVLPKRPIVLSIAGFDPSGGAGILADIKTFESLKTYGLAVQTALTVQNDVEFLSCHWTEEKYILAQMEVLLKRYHIQVVKIGIVQNKNLLLKLLQIIKQYAGDIPIVWDPVLKSSTGFTFHSTSDALLEECLKSIFVMTPNWEEMETLYGKDFQHRISDITKYCSIYVKGGHREEQKKGEDILYKKLGKVSVFRPRSIECMDKHGSGCVFSSALAGYLARGFSLQKAALRAKCYAEHFLKSNPSLLGYHKF